MAPRTLDRVGEWLDEQTTMWRWVDPETFTAACVDLEVWDGWEDADPSLALADYFDPSEILAATLRFLNVAEALADDTLAEFTFDTDDGQTAIPTAVFWTAATAPFDDAERGLEPRAWRVAIIERIKTEG